MNRTGGTSSRPGPSPVCVGGVGGSGTRVVARILAELGLWLGSDLSEADDNLWFAYLFHRPDWVDAARASSRPVLESHLGTFTRLSLGRPLTVEDRARILRVPLTGTVSSVMAHPRRLLWRLGRLRSMFGRRPGPPAKATGWGWKAPITHLFIDVIAASFSAPRYVHVIRHGLDMALSSNHRQWHHWGAHFGLRTRGRGRPSPGQLLEYWIRANTRAVETGRARLGDRFYLLRFESLCLDTEEEIRSLLGFLDVPPAPRLVARLAAIPRRPDSLGRWRALGPSAFDREQTARVEALGFSC